jgi:hypothetical protein
MFEKNGIKVTYGDLREIDTSMENDNKKLISLRDYMIKNRLKFVLPHELKT